MGKNNPDPRWDRREPYNQPIKTYGEANPRAALRLAKLGGAEPRLKAPRRRRPRPTGLSAEIITLARRLKKIQAKARKLGLFVEDRELLTCSRCGLQEDVAIDGRLLVTVPGNRHCDTGLRFTRVMRRGDWWRCPNCKSVLKEPFVDVEGRGTTLENWIAEEMRDPEFRRHYAAADAEMKAREKRAKRRGTK